MILRGLAKTCFILRAKSSTDISVGPISPPTTFDGNFREKLSSLSSEGSMKSGLRNLRVLSYPLVSSSTSIYPTTSTSPLLDVPPAQASSVTECYGVLQVVIPLEKGGRSVTGGHSGEINLPSSTLYKGNDDSEKKSKWLNGSKHLDDCCVELARMISAATMMHRSMVSKNNRLLALEETIQSWDDRRTDQEAMTQRWMHQAISWQSLTQLIASLLALANECADFPTATRQAEMNHASSSLLRTHAGISLLVRNASAADRDAFRTAGGSMTTIGIATTPVRTHTQVDSHGHASPISRLVQVVPLDKDGTVVVEIRHHPPSEMHLRVPSPTNANISFLGQVHPSSVIGHPSSSVGALEANATTVPSTGPSELIDLLCVLLQSIRTLHEEKQRVNSAVSSSSSSSSMVTPTRAGITSSSSVSSSASSTASSAASVYGWKPHHPGTHSSHA